VPKGERRRGGLSDIIMLRIWIANTEGAGLTPSRRPAWCTSSEPACAAPHQPASSKDQSPPAGNQPSQHLTSIAKNRKPRTHKLTSPDRTVT
jgi:hypothetical protein